MNQLNLWDLYEAYRAEGGADVATMFIDWVVAEQQAAEAEAKRQADEFHRQIVEHTIRELEAEGYTVTKNDVPFSEQPLS